ncbi:hypothetical protein [Pseudobacter ginsenosidimutans]|uniref:Uncharacterized protein n=1 Tax=Pseudobacter ginsenosidimutans TaxID=661488 RepID=A0A4Q7N0Z6_9BACT|nr:hypothetical protein [Pseudobacter ginsenosidimutans]QEC43456.1 hypothetical protein FSB84_17830 [Pseudobacter ginsenosidimutans]RZS74842.1 hypothetical protein EV199_0693 [Pseudobacter ginsenosidimutans]
MKKILSFAIVLITLHSCKKEKAEYNPTTVENGSGTLYYQEANTPNNTNWYSASEMIGLSLPNISKSADIQKNIVFGFYNKGDEYGIYSPDNFPKMYGQENWQTRLSIKFRKTNLTIVQMQEWADQYQEKLPPQLIVEEWKKGYNERNYITHPQEGETYAFRSNDGKLTALMMITSVNSFFTSIGFVIWIAK